MQLYLLRTIVLQYYTYTYVAVRSIQLSVCAAGSKELLALRQIWQRGAVMPDCLAPLPAATDLAAAISVCLQSKTAPAQEVTDTAQKPGAAENAPVLAARRLQLAWRRASNVFKPFALEVA